MSYCGVLGLAFSLSALAPRSVAATPAALEGGPRQSVRLMHIGNSFSWNATTYLPELAKAGGKQITIFANSLGGCSLERHAKHLAQAKAGDPEGSPYQVTPSLGLKDKTQKKVSMPEALAAQKWGFVTIQQVSIKSFYPKTYEPYAKQIIDEIREKAPQATILVHQTWNYNPKHPVYKRVKDFSPEKMYERLTAAYTDLGKRYGIGFLPSGNAVHNAEKLPQWQYVPDPDFDYANPPAGKAPKEKNKGLHPGYHLKKQKNGKMKLAYDGTHLNVAGKYLTGCVWYEVLFNDSVLAVDFTPKGLTPAQAAELRQIAHDTVARYRETGTL